MGQQSRREMLEEMLAADPNDTFLRYGLAMELAREGNVSDAIARLRALIADEAGYVPAYFQAAQLLLREGDQDAAADLLRRGIETARSRSDLHAAEEMSALLAQLDSP